MAGAELWLLDHISETGWLRKGRFHDVGLMADDDRDRARLKRSSSRENVGDHRPAGHSVQNFGPRRLDTRALAGREDDNVNVGHRLIIYRLGAVRTGGRPQGRGGLALT